MKVVFHAHAYKSHGRNAGAETTAHDLLKSLAARGWDVQVVLDRIIPEDYELDGVRVEGFKHKSDFNVAAAGADLFISQLDCSERAVYVARSLNRPIVHIVHNEMWHVEGYLGLGCDLAVYNTNWVKESLEGRTKEPVVHAASAGRVDFRFRSTYSWPGIVVHPPVDPAEYRVEKIGKYVTLVNLFDNKGPEVFFELARKNPSIPFLAVLGGYGDQEIPKDVPRNVEFIPNQSDMRNVYSQTRILLMPSKYESFGRIAIEGAASGIPTICSPTPGLVESMSPLTTKWKWYADREDIDDWNMKLNTLWEYEGWYNEASNHARAISNYWDIQREPEIEHFNDCIDLLMEGGKEAVEEYLER